MTDLYLGIFILLLESAGLFAFGRWFGRRVRPRTAGLLFMVTVLLLLAYQKFAADQLWMARFLPFSNLVVIGNFYPPLVSFAAATALRNLPHGGLRRSMLLIPFLALSWVGLIQTVFGGTPQLGNRWSAGVCIQTSGASCSAAAAATLLRPYRIKTTEQEMAQLCLTHAGVPNPDGTTLRTDGTTMHGLYRGLKLKTAGTEWKPVPFHESLEELQKSLAGPVILSVELPVGDPRAARFEAWGWGPGTRHTVVLFRFLPFDEAEMGDPETGRERWTLDDLRVLWHGEGIKIVARAARP